jgi:hypothetical protein
MFRIRNDMDRPIAEVETLSQIGRAIRTAKPGCYYIDEITLEPLPSGDTSRRWGMSIKHVDGKIMMLPDPWEA